MLEGLHARFLKIAEEFALITEKSFSDFTNNWNKLRKAIPILASKQLKSPAALKLIPEAKKAASILGKFSDK